MEIDGYLFFLKSLLVLIEEERVSIASVLDGDLLTGYRRILDSERENLRREIKNCF